MKTTTITVEVGEMFARSVFGLTVMFLDITEEERGDGEVSKRSVGEEKRFWLPSETDTFLQLIEENYAKFFSPHKKSVFWNMISKKLEQENIFVRI